MAWRASKRRGWFAKSVMTVSVKVVVEVELATLKLGARVSRRIKKGRGGVDRDDIHGAGGNSCLEIGRAVDGTMAIGQVGGWVGVSMSRMDWRVR